MLNCGICSRENVKNADYIYLMTYLVNFPILLCGMSALARGAILLLFLSRGARHR